jgi:O-antigen/teichoic acid export membrane protein
LKRMMQGADFNPFAPNETTGKKTPRTKSVPEGQGITPGPDCSSQFHPAKSIVTRMVTVDSRRSCQKELLAVDKPIDPHLSDIDPFEGVEAAAQEHLDERLDDATIERRATHGVGLLVAQMFALQLLTLAVTVVLARTLTVADYGVFAIAIALQQAGHALVELGVPAALIGRPDPPTEHEQRSVTGFVLVAAVGVCSTVGLVAYLIIPALGSSSHVLQLALIACLALPVMAFRTMPTVLLERRLRYGRVTALYTVETIVFNLAALAGVLAGWGGSALVIAVPVGAFAGMITAKALQRTARGVSWDFGVIRPLVSFGSQVSARQGIVLARDLTFVGLIVAIGGQTTAGYYAMSQRILGVPIAFSTALLRVGFPAMARSEGDQTKVHAAARSIAVSAAAVSLLLALSAGAAYPLLETLFGARWTPASEVVVPAAAGLLLMASAGSIVASLNFSMGQARTPLVSAIVDSIVLCVSAIFLIKWNSTVGTGISIFVGATAGVAVLVFRAPGPVKASMLSVLRAFVIAAAATAAGILVPAGHGLGALVASIVAVALVWLVLTFTFSRAEMKSMLDLVRRGLKRSPASETDPVRT